MPDANCNQNRDPLKLVREGTSQAQRPFPALDPAFAPVDGRTMAHGMVFAQALSAFLKYYELTNVPVDSWQRFFGQDVSLQLAVAAIQDVDEYRQQVKEYFDFLDEILHSDASFEIDCRKHLGYLFSCIGTLAVRLDKLTTYLPDEFPLKATLKNAINSQLAPQFQQFWGYYKHDLSLAANGLITNLPAPVPILGGTGMPISEAAVFAFSDIWVPKGVVPTSWSAFYISIPSLNGYGAGGTSIFTQINHLSTHNLFTSIFDQFLKTYARVVSDTKDALENSFTNYDRHEPHYALFLAFLKLMEHARNEINTLTGRHLDFYYKEILQLKEKPAEPGHAHLLIELAKHANDHEIKTGELFKAGTDDLGKDAFFANDRNFVANKAKVADLKTIYRHGDEPVGDTAGIKDTQTGRLYASPIANSDDGLGAELISDDKSWHPFFNKIYENGDLTNIKMPMAEVGFAIASHHLLIAEGTRIITINFSITSGLNSDTVYDENDFECWLTGEKDWIIKTPDLVSFSINGSVQQLQIRVPLTGADPAVTPYSAKIHGYFFDTNLPVLLVKLKHDKERIFLYTHFQGVQISGIDLKVSTSGLRTLAVSNDFGPVDTAKPFQPYGASPVVNAAFIVGSKEVFQKKLSKLTINLTWQNAPKPYGTTVNFSTLYLQNGEWQDSGVAEKGIGSQSVSLNAGLEKPVVDAPDFSEQEIYNTAALHGFVRFRLNSGFGQAAFDNDLIAYIKRVTDNDANNDGTKPLPPTGPFVSAIDIDYDTIQNITISSNEKIKFEERTAKFFHLCPFGHAEQHTFLKKQSVLKDNPILGNQSTIEAHVIYLFPQLKHLNKLDPAINIDGPVTHEAEFFIGISGLRPPQNLSLLFQVVDGTTDPLSAKPDPHLHWSYLRNNEWIDFTKDQVEDHTRELTHSGIITFAMPRDAADINTVLSTGMHWIRMAVEKQSDTVCRLQMVAAQAIEVTFADQKNDTAFPAKTLESGTIAKLAQPDADVKKVEQPFPSFGGRGQEDAAGFYTRVSERLRHKDRAIALWDYERLVLEAFPALYKAKCLNHTQYEPNEEGTGVYRELAAGHVTIVTVPNQQFHNLRDPLKPYTSLGLLLDVADFFKKRTSCFVKLHVKNPQFEEVKTKFQVRFNEGFDETFFINKLKQEITRFLSPWAYLGGGSPTFGGKIYKSVLINFIEDRYYVDYVTDFQLFHYYPGQTNAEEDLNEVEGSIAVSILVSVPEKEHDINFLPIATAIDAREKCDCES
jgi:hypothetical protein